MKASILTIGNELLIGQVIDTNSSWIGQELVHFGVEMIEKRSISDGNQAIKDALGELVKISDCVFLTGGLGPTKDDITKKAIAEFLGIGMYFDQKLYNRIEAYFVKRGIPIKEAHKDQCYMPEGVVLIENNMGTAPGMLFEFEGTKIFSMPGVPYEMKYIFNNGIKPMLEASNDSMEIFHRTIHTAGTGETVIAEMIDDVLNDFPPELSIAYLPGLAQVRVRITGQAPQSFGVKKVVLDFAERIEEVISKYVFGYDGATLPGSVLSMLKEQNKTIGFAESCSGGKLSHLIVSEAGASSVFNGSIVAYSNELKKNLLGVDASTLDKYGAVSQETVIEMVNGCLRATNSDYAVSISGIAGPTGGTEEKPVGTIWMCVGNKERNLTHRLTLTKDRKINIQYACMAALNFLRIFISKNEKTKMSI